MDIQDRAYRDQDRMYGFLRGQPSTYFFEGVVAVAAMIGALVAFILDDTAASRRYVVVRGAGMLLFGLLELQFFIIESDGIRLSRRRRC